MGSVFGTCIVRVFGLAAGSTGLNEKACRDAKIEYRAATIQAPHHASYFPGAKNLTLKIIYRAGDGKLLGAQAVGAEGCDKRLDVIATAMHFGGTIDDLCKLDLAYAPPFGSAKDPLHMAAFVAENDLRHVPTLVEFDSELDGLQIVDVRNASEIAQLPLAGAKWIPIDELAERWTELDPKRPTVTVCHSGKRAHIAACWLQGQGFAAVKNLNGGMSMRSLR
jgi:rhodanese-related sulfurtransferase